jgi:hypothetical protein
MDEPLANCGGATISSWYPIMAELDGLRIAQSLVSYVKYHPIFVSKLSSMDMRWDNLGQSRCESSSEKTGDQRHPTPPVWKHYSGPAG